MAPNVAFNINLIENKFMEIMAIKPDF